MKKMFLIAILSMFLMNCSNDDNGGFTPQNIDFTTIRQSITEPFINMEEGQNNIVVTNESDWNQLVEDLFLVAVEFPEIDFNTFQVIVSIDDIRFNTGFWLEITEIIENENNITVTITTGEYDSAFEAYCRPYHIVKIPKSNKPVVFE